MRNPIKSLKSTVKKILVILLGTCIYSAGVGLFLDPNELAPGGVVGLSVVLSHSVGGATGSWYFILNIPIILLGWWKFGGKFIIYSFYAISLNSIFTNMFSVFPTVTDNLLLASIAGSVLMGTGIGLVLRIGATTGGMDIVIRLLRRKFPAIKTSTLFIVIDIIIVAISGFVFGDFNIAMFAFITVVLNGRVMDYILYGSDEAGLIYIVSDESQRILSRILKELEIGATLLTGKGAYSSQEKQIIMCVIKRRRIPRLEEIVKQEDCRAFMIVTSASEIYGEGYKNISAEQL
ncbi:MAG: YitT family protein [Lachnospiraceae bacterium]|nr:YitT family protein [Lachnospiraceae bacterium]MDE6625794.1 YitT family protein [Lachnospiraceae bacterium]